MRPEISRRDDVLGMVDIEKGTVDRKIFSDQAIYDLEMERVFARAWNFMAHDSQIPNPGDFFQTYIGEDRVIVVRDKSGRPQVLLNTCRHRGNAVCRAEEGHATSFMCTYHGWTYDLQGKLVGVPGFKDYYHEELDRDGWGLVTAAQVDTYKGFIFATLDPEAPGLADYLGEVGTLGLSLLAERGNIEIVGGIQKYVIGCNWKLAVDNLFDWYHPMLTHASAVLSGGLFPPPPADGPPAPPPPPMDQVLNMSQPQLVMLGEFGHAIAGPQIMWGPDGKRINFPGTDDTWRDRPGVSQELGQVGMETQGHPNIFPNLWVSHNSNQLSLRVPKGPGATEIWWFTFLDKGMPEQAYGMMRSAAVHVFGPAGLLEQEDGENWDQSTRGTLGTVARRYPLNFAMNRGHADVIDDETGPPHIKANISEHAQFWTYRAWTEWMAAENWQELKTNHATVPTGRI